MIVLNGSHRFKARHGLFTQSNGIRNHRYYEYTPGNHKYEVHSHCLTDYSYFHILKTLNVLKIQEVQMDEQEMDQWREVGRSAREAKEKGGCSGWLIIIIIAIIVLIYFSSLHRNL
jgi:hypothetical protein